MFIRRDLTYKQRQEIKARRATGEGSTGTVNSGRVHPATPTPQPGAGPNRALPGPGDDPEGSVPVPGTQDENETVPKRPTAPGQSNL